MTIEQRVLQTLRTSPYRELQSVHCELDGRVLTLRGQVSSYYMKQLAQAILRNVQSIERIHNALVVDHPLWHDAPRRD